MSLKSSVILHIEISVIQALLLKEWPFDIKKKDCKILACTDIRIGMSSKSAWRPVFGSLLFKTSLTYNHVKCALCHYGHYPPKSGNIPHEPHINYSVIYKRMYEWMKQTPISLPPHGELQMYGTE